MGVIGIDFGNRSSVVAVKTEWEIDTLQIPSVVFFSDDQRLFGKVAATAALEMPERSVSEIKSLIGIPFSDPELQKNMNRLPFIVTPGPDGFPLIHIRYMGKARTFTPTQLLGMLFSNLKAVAQKTLRDDAVVDCCIGIPSYFNDLQRRAVLNAAEIAGLNPLRLVHGTTATAMAYAASKVDFIEDNPVNVVFIDIGHASMQVCIAKYEKGKMTILAHSFDKSLGGREFDDGLFQNMASKIQEGCDVNIGRSRRASFLLRMACEELKKIMCDNPDIPFYYLPPRHMLEQRSIRNFDRVMEPFDKALAEVGLGRKAFRGFIKREEFEQISIPIVERMKKPLENALAEAGLAAENIQAFEVVGSGSLVPEVTKTFSEFFGKKPRRTISSSREDVAEVCALQCEIPKPELKAGEFLVTESFPFPFALTWRDCAHDVQHIEFKSQHIIFSKGTPIPSFNALTVYQPSEFTVADVWYDDDDVGLLQPPAKLSSFEIGPFQSPEGEHVQLKIKVGLDWNGIISVKSATTSEDEEVGVTEGTSIAHDVPEFMEQPSCMHTDPREKIVFKVHDTLSQAALEEARKQEMCMASQDMKMQDKIDKIDEMMNYAELMKFKLLRNFSGAFPLFDGGKLVHEFDLLERKLKTWWINGEDALNEIIDKFEALKLMCDVMDKQYKDSIEQLQLRQQLEHLVTCYRQAAFSASFDHIDHVDKQRVLDMCAEVEAWLKEKRQAQNPYSANASSPIITSAELSWKIDALDRFCRSIMSKPKPTPSLRALETQKGPLKAAVGVLVVTTLGVLLLRR